MVAAGVQLGSENKVVFTNRTTRDFSLRRGGGGVRSLTRGFILRSVFKGVESVEGLSRSPEVF